MYQFKRDIKCEVDDRSHKEELCTMITGKKASLNFLKPYKSNVIFDEAGGKGAIVHKKATKEVTVKMYYKHYSCIYLMQGRTIILQNCSSSELKR